MFGIDPTFIRIGLVAVPLLTRWKFALIAYVVAGIFLHIQKKRRDERQGPAVANSSGWTRSASGRTSVHAMRTKLDVNDRRHDGDRRPSPHPNDELAREIEALQEEK